MHCNAIEDSLVWEKVDKALIPSLITFPKFSLPTLGQFYCTASANVAKSEYRPIEDLHARSDGKFNMYVHDFELDMILCPPFENFILEFSGFDDKIFIKTAEHMPEDVTFSKYILVCQKIEAGILIKPFYFNEKAIDVCPIGWITNAPIVLKYLAPEDRTPTPSGIGFGLMLVLNENSSNYSVKVGSTMGPEIRALLQFLVVVSMRHGIDKEISQSHRKIIARTGRRLGYDYHVLKISSEYVIGEKESMGGHHASPRFHLRRAHLRQLKSGKVVFVKQAYVGDIKRGIVDKDYKLDL